MDHPDFGGDPRRSEPPDPDTLSMKTSPRARRVRTISPDASAQEAAELMGQWHVGFLVVVEDSIPVGVVSDRDLAMRTLARGLRPSECRVSQVMTTPVVTLANGSSHQDASKLMRKHRIRKLPVVDSNGRIVSVLTADDLLESLGKQVHGLAKAVSRELDNEAIEDPGGSSIFGRE